MNTTLALHAHSMFHNQFKITPAGKLVPKFWYTKTWRAVEWWTFVFLLMFGLPNVTGHSHLPYYSSNVVKAEKEPATLTFLKTETRTADTLFLKEIVENVGSAASISKLDPSLLLAVMKIESNFDQYAMSSKGAMCLMQIMPNWHALLLIDSFKKYETRNMYDVNVCVHAGATILAKYIQDQGGSVERGLLQYNGSLNDSTKVYANKVLQEKRRIEKFLKGQSA